MKEKQDSVLKRIKEEARTSGKASSYAPYYFEVFGYGENGEQLNGKTILDVGAGSNDFVKVVNETGLAKVVALDPKYLSLSSPYPERSVVGIAQMLPFKDEAFDETIASYSLIWIHTNIDHVLREMLRVTKKGGTVKIHPVELKPGALLRHKMPDQAMEKSLPIDVRGGDVLIITKDTNVSTSQWESNLRTIGQCIDFVPKDLRILTMRNRVSRLPKYSPFLSFR